MAEKELFEIYVAGLEETKRLRESIEERMQVSKEVLDRLKARFEEWRTSRSHDPVETLGVSEYTKSMQELSQKVSECSMAILKGLARFDGELLDRAQAMLKAENYDLKGLFEVRLIETRRRLEEELPQLFRYQEELNELRERFEAFLNETISKPIPKS